MMFTGDLAWLGVHRPAVVYLIEAERARSSMIEEWGCCLIGTYQCTLYKAAVTVVSQYGR